MKKQHLHLVASHGFHEAGSVFMERTKCKLRERMRRLYPQARERLIAAAADRALRSGIRYTNAARLSDRTLGQAMQTVLRHEVVAADHVMDNLAAEFGFSRLGDDPEMYLEIKAHLAAIARIAERKLAEPISGVKDVA